MEAEIVKMARICNEFIPIIYMVDILGQSVGLPVRYFIINVSMRKDNVGTLVLAEALPPQFTPRLKHYATKNIWLCEDIFKRGIKLVNIDTLQQLGGF